MNLTRTFIAIGFIFTCIAVVPAQEQCKLNVAQLPTLRGLRLGMTTEQVRSVFPGMQSEAKGDLGQINTSVSRDYSGTNGPIFKDIYGIDFTFFDNKLVDFTIQYDYSVHWDTLESFIAKVSESLRLPNLWENEGGFSKKLKCDGFIIRANNINRAGAIRFNDTSWLLVAQKRIHDEEEKRRQTFQP